MAEEDRKALSYYRNKLGLFLERHHPERVNDRAFVTTRADEALDTYCDAVRQGFNPLEAEAMASETLYRGLHFSRHDMIVRILEEEFPREFPPPLPQRLAPLLLGIQAVKDVFARYDTDDHFDASPEAGLLYTELTGVVLLLIEENHLPTVL